MTLFVTSSIWCSLLFSVMRDAAAAAAVNSWPSWLWIPELPSPLLSSPHFCAQTFCFFSFFCLKNLARCRVWSWWGPGIPTNPLFYYPLKKALRVQKKTRVQNFQEWRLQMAKRSWKDHGDPGSLLVTYPETRSQTQRHTNTCHGTITTHKHTPRHDHTPGILKHETRTKHLPLWVPLQFLLGENSYSLSYIHTWTGHVTPPLESQ